MTEFSTDYDDGHGNWLSLDDFEAIEHPSREMNAVLLAVGFGLLAAGMAVVAGATVLLR